MIYGHCPTCGTEIPTERRQQGYEICSACGWSDPTPSHKRQDRTETGSIILIALISVFVVTAFTHIVHWDTHSMEILPLKYRQLTNKASNADLFQIATICEDRKKPSCMQEALAQLHKQDPNHLKGLRQYARVLNFNGQYDLAIQKYAEYFSKGGTHLDSAYKFAKLLARVGKIEHASNYYRYVLDAKPETLQVTVTEHFVDMLMQSNRLEEAKMLIKGIRDKGTNTDYFLEERLTQIEKLMKRKS